MSRTVRSGETCEITADAHRNDIVRPHLDCEEEVGISLRSHDILHRLWIHIVTKPIFVKPTRQAVRVIFIPVPLRLEVFERQVGHAM